MTTSPSAVLDPSALVAVSDAPAGQCGAIVWWRLSGGLDLVALTAAWEAEGLDVGLLPTAPSARVALRRTARGMKLSGEIVVHRDGFALGAISDDAPDANANATDTADMKVRVRGAMKLDADGNLLVRGSLDADDVAARFAANRANLSQRDASHWLSDLTEEVDAIALRDTGGVYFVPRYALPTWNAMLRAVRAASAHTVSCVPAMSSDEAATAFLDAMRAAAMKAAAEIADDVAKLSADGSPEFGPRALRARVARTERVEAQVAKYEEVLGGKLDDVRAEIQAVRAQLVIAMTIADVAAAAELAPR